MGQPEIPNSGKKREYDDDDILLPLFEFSLAVLARDFRAVRAESQQAETQFILIEKRLNVSHSRLLNTAGGEKQLFTGLVS